MSDFGNWYNGASDKTMTASTLFVILTVTQLIVGGRVQGSRDWNVAEEVQFKDDALSLTGFFKE